MLFLFVDVYSAQLSVSERHDSDCRHWDDQKAESLSFFGREVDIVWRLVATKPHLKT